MTIYQHEAKDLKKRLRSAEDNVKSTETENNRYLSILKEVHTKISPIITTQVQSVVNTSSTSANNKTSSDKIGNDDSSIVNGKSSAVCE